MRKELVIGRVRTAHGVRGELKVESLSGETGHFRGLREVTLVRPGGDGPPGDAGQGSRRHTFPVEAVRFGHHIVLLKLAGIDSPETAKRWRDWEIVVSRADAAPLGHDEYYYADLVGLSVYVDDEERGRVSNLWEGGPTVLLGITLPDGSARLVPFQAEFVASVDLEGGRLVLADDEVLS